MKPDFSAIKGYRVISYFTGFALMSIAFCMVSFQVGLITPNYTRFFFLLTLFTGIYFLMEKLWWKKHFIHQNSFTHKPWWSKWTSQLFPLILIIFIIRAFFIEQYRIPSGSMIPNLWSGDIILVNKLSYQVRSPWNSKVLLEIEKPKRFDIAVFDFPGDPEVSYVKRIVGLPGDTITYDLRMKKLYINGEEIKEELKALYKEENEAKNTPLFLQKTSDKEFEILKNISPDNINQIIHNEGFKPNPYCQYLQTKLICKVPEKNYFGMGDNRDNSLDSRYWGFIPEENLTGKPIKIVFNISAPQRLWIETK